MSFEKNGNNRNVYFHSFPINIDKNLSNETIRNKFKRQKDQKNPLWLFTGVYGLYTKWHNAAVRRVVARPVARPVSCFFVDAEGLQIHFMETIPTHATSLRRLGEMELGQLDKWMMMDDGWWVVTGGLIYAVFKIDVEKICWNIFERKVPGNSKWHKTRSPIVSGSQPNLWKGHSCHDRKRRTVMSRELPNLISTWNVTSIIRQESPETLKISTKI